MGKILFLKFKMFFRDYPAVFFTLIFCPLLLIIFGTAMGNEPNPAFDGLGPIDISVPTYIITISAGVSLLSFPIAYVGSKERGELKRQKMFPVSPFVMLLLDSLIYFVLAIVGMIILVVTAGVIYGTAYPDNMLNIIPAIFITFFSIFSIGILISVLMQTVKATQAFCFALFFLMLFTSGQSTPLETMSDKMLRISDFIPLKYSVVVMKNVWKGETIFNLHKELIVVIGIFICCIILAYVMERLRSNK